MGLFGNIKREVKQIKSMPKEELKAKLMPKELYSVEAVAGLASPVKKIHPHDVAKMTEFIDYVRLKKPSNLNLELDASRLAEHYKTRMPKTTAGLANEFDNVLSKIRQKGLFRR